MPLFKVKPNLADGEKAKVEFHFQQLAETIGYDRLKLGFQTVEQLTGLSESGMSPEQILIYVGEHLSHDVSDLHIEIEPQKVEQCGGGG